MQKYNTERLHYNKKYVLNTIYFELKGMQQILVLPNFELRPHLRACEC